MEYPTHNSGFAAAIASNRWDLHRRNPLYELLVNECIANGQPDREFSKEQRDLWESKLQRTNSLSRKKQIRRSERGWNGCKVVHEKDRDRVTHRREHVRVAQDCDSGENAAESPRWLDSSSGNSAESNFDSDGSELSSHSTATSRSSSHTRNFCHTINGPRKEPNPEAPGASFHQGSLKVWATTRSSSNRKMAVSPLSSTAREIVVRQGAVVNGDRTNFESSRSRGDDGDNDQDPFTESGMSSGTSQPEAPSAMEEDDPSTEGDSSSKSQTSSTVSKSSSSEKKEDDTQPDDKLKDLVKNHVLRADPEVADLFLQAVGDQLEFAPNEDAEQPEDYAGLSLLRLLELTRSTNVQDCHGIRKYAPSSSSGSSSSSSSSSGPGAASSSSPGGHVSGSGAVPRGSSAPDGGPRQTIKGQKTSVKSGGSNSTKAQPFRCPHNAIFPEIFCVNHETQDRFRACAGPGWSSIQHLKEHMQSHHTKKVKKQNSLQCSDCQDRFHNQEELKSHKEDVDCPIRCRDCLEVFDTKAKRTDHQKESHREEEAEFNFLEIDEAMSKKIKDNLRLYSDSVKKGPKAKGRSDPALESWVDANTTRYMIGRPAKTNPKMELGQWYTIFKTLAPTVEILEHPFYDYGVMIPHSDFIEEKIIFINDHLIECRITAHGPPPSDIPLQRDWYRGVLRETLQVAAQTYFSPKKTAASPVQTTQESSTNGPSESAIQNRGYDMPMMSLQHNSQMNNIHSGMPIQQGAFIANGQAQNGMMAGMQEAGTSMNGDLGLESWFHAQVGISDAGTQLLYPSSGYEYSSNYPMGFEHQGSNLMAGPQYSSDWQDSQGQGQKRRRTD